LGKRTYWLSASVSREALARVTRGRGRKAIRWIRWDVVEAIEVGKKKGKVLKRRRKKGEMRDGKKKGGEEGTWVFLCGVFRGRGKKTGRKGLCSLSQEGGKGERKKMEPRFVFSADREEKGKRWGKKGGKEIGNALL